MTTLKMLSKLGNAVREKRGLLVKTPKGPRPYFRSTSPRKDKVAQERIERWQFRLKKEKNLIFSL